MTPLTKDAVREIVFSALARIVPEMDRQTIELNVPLRDQLDLDSMDFLNFTIALHERTGVDIPEGDRSRLVSIDAIVDYLVSRQTTA